MITTIVAYHSASTGGVAGRDILSEYFGGQDAGLGLQHPGQADVSDTLVSQLASIQGVQAVTVVRAVEERGRRSRLRPLLTGRRDSAVGKMLHFHWNLSPP